METDLWHETTLQRLTIMLQSDPGVLTLAVFGSYLRPEVLDVWSDLDLLLVVDDWRPWARSTRMNSRLPRCGTRPGYASRI
jgi:predicted nucleotidyltransferase